MATQSETVDISELRDQPRKLGGLQVVTVAERDPYINMLVYGHPGSGKTVLAGGAHMVAEMSPVIVIDVEGGTMSLQGYFPDVDVVRVKSWKELETIYAELYRGKHGYNTVVLDSLSEIQKLSMSMIMREVVMNDNSRDPDIPSIREWGKNGEQTRRLVRAFRDLSVNVIFTALAIEERDQKTGLNKFRPGLSGKLSNEVSGYMDLVGYLYTKPKDDKICRFLLTGTTDTHVAKDRSNKLPQVVEQPSMETIHTHIFGNEDKVHEG